jgi:hypothetical protein
MLPQFIRDTDILGFPLIKKISIVSTEGFKREKEIQYPGPQAFKARY